MVSAGYRRVFEIFSQFDDWYVNRQAAERLLTWTSAG
jgi:hypothetical protein